MRLTPAVFWALSLVEWRAMIARDAPSSLARGDLEQLMRMYPDGQE